MMQLDARTLALAQQQLQLQQQLHGQSTATPSFMQTDAGKPNATGATGVVPLSKATKRSLDESSQAGDHRKSVKAEVSSCMASPPLSTLNPVLSEQRCCDLSDLKVKDCFFNRAFVSQHLSMCDFVNFKPSRARKLSVVDPKASRWPEAFSSLAALDTV
jgi:hypothetical protein